MSKTVEDVLGPLSTTELLRMRYRIVGYRDMDAVPLLPVIDRLLAQREL